MGILLSDHGGDVVWLLEVVPSWWQQSWGDFAEEHGDVVNEDKEDDTGDNTVCDVV